MFNNFYNPQQIVHVNGENGARAYNMPMPNSSVLLLDENDPIVWLVMTDGAGYKTVTPYHIEPFVVEPEPDLKSLLTRIENLEERINESYHEHSEPKGKQQTNSTNK